MQWQFDSLLLSTHICTSSSNEHIHIVIYRKYSGILLKEEVQLLAIHLKSERRDRISRS